MGSRQIRRKTVNGFVSQSQAWNWNGGKARELLLPNSLGNVAKGVDCGSSDCLLVSFQKLQQLETDSHPLPSGHVLRPPT